MLEAGTKLGPYEIVSPLGSGGMGEVYRARDARLGREVAIKVLPVHLSANPEVRTRFEREARTVSSLNHPNICTLFDVGREGETDYLVMELIEGETLAERIRRGPLPAPELLRIGAQIADALDRAHRAGVIHRDLKPGNIMLTRSGAKLMDFGLARATGLAGPASGSGASLAALTQSPTVAQALTAEGSLIGTFQYMAPEQLEGGEADTRSDIWALGCVLYEMATGRRAFEGRSQASLIAAILEREPSSVGEAPSGTSGTSAASRATGGAGAPAGLDRLIRACLAKDPEERLQTAHDVKLQLQWIAESAGLSSAGTPAPVAAPVASQPARSAQLAWVIAAAAALAAVAVFAWLWPRAHAPRQDFRFRTEPLARVADYYWPRVSPDGAAMVMHAVDSSGVARAWLRPMDQTLARPILGSEGLTRAYWSPDSREIVFVAGGKIQRLAVTGGTPTVVCEAQGGADLSWSSRGQILMDGRTADSLRVVPARGGELRPATRVDRAAGEVGSAWPCFLPDGEHFLFIGTMVSASGGGNIRLGKLGSLDSKLLGHSDGRAEYAPGGWVLYLKGSTLLAQKLDLGAAKLTGQPLTLVENVRVGSSAGHFSISPSGILAYSRGGEAAVSTLALSGRDGRPTADGLTSGLIANPTISPQGDRITYEKLPAGSNSSEVWVRDLTRGTETKLAFGVGSSRMPVWSPDGRRIAWILNDTGVPGSVLLAGSADGLGARDSVRMPDMGAPMLTQWATSGSRIIVVAPDFSQTYEASLEGTERSLRPVPGFSGFAGQSQLSPDGRWMAYVSNSSGPPQVYVQGVAGTPGRWQVSTTDGIWPRWTKGGREMVYEARDGIMAVDIDAADGFHVGTPRKLFEVPLAGAPDKRYWCCTDDGERFALLIPPRLIATGSIEVVTDFASLINRR